MSLIDLEEAFDSVLGEVIGKANNHMKLILTNWKLKLEERHSEI